MHSRRTFVVSGIAASAAAALSVARAADNGQPARASEAPPAQPKLKMSSQLGVLPGKELAEKLAFLQKEGFDAAELPGNCVGEEKAYRDAIKNTNLVFSALCWGSAKGALVSEVPERRAEGLEQLKRAIETAGELKSTGVIYVPAFNKDTKLTNQEIRQILLDTLPAVGEFAVKNKTRVLLEPLNRKEAYFLRQLADAAAICRDVNSPGIGMMGDFYHMCIEETSDMGAFISAGSYLHHVHLASRTRKLPGQDERSFVDGFRGLKMIGFQGYCSFECGVNGDRATEIPKSVAFLREQWAKA